MVVLFESCFARIDHLLRRHPTLFHENLPYNHRVGIDPIDYPPRHFVVDEAKLMTDIFCRLTALVDYVASRSFLVAVNGEAESQPQFGLRG